MKGRVLRQDVNETKERIIKAVKAACNGKCELVAIKESETTDSLYFTISNGRVETFFRISDHPTRQKIKSFTVSKSTRMDAVVRFVSNTVNRLNRFSLYQLLETVGCGLAIA